MGPFQELAKWVNFRRPSTTGQARRLAGRGRTTDPVVSVGQQYRSIDATRDVWQVAAIMQVHGHGHVRLVRVGDRQTNKLLATSTLQDAQAFQLIDPPDARP